MCDGRIPFLIVEDHQILRKTIRGWFEMKLSNFRFEEADCGEQAVAIAQVWRPKIILMDMNLPLLNGAEATLKIKQILPDTRIIVFSIYQDPYYRERALTAGASCFIDKGSIYTDLLPAIDQLMAVE